MPLSFISWCQCGVLLALQAMILQVSCKSSIFMFGRSLCILRFSSWMILLISIEALSPFILGIYRSMTMSLNTLLGHLQDLLSCYLTRSSAMSPSLATCIISFTVNSFIEFFSSFDIKYSSTYRLNGSSSTISIDG